MRDLRDQTKGQGYAQTSTPFFIKKVYLWMIAATGLSVLANYFVVNTPYLFNAIFDNTTMSLILLFVTLALMVLFISKYIRSARIAAGIFLVNATLLGILSANLDFTEYTNTTVIQVFLITAAIFIAIIVYGDLTKRDLFAIIGTILEKMFVPDDTKEGTRKPTLYDNFSTRRKVILDAWTLHIIFLSTFKLVFGFLAVYYGV